MKVVVGRIWSPVFGKVRLSVIRFSGALTRFWVPTGIMFFILDITITLITVLLNMRYIITVTEIPPNGPGRFVFSGQIDSEDDNTLKSVLSDICKNNVKITNSKKLVVLDVDETEHALYLEGPGKQAPRNGKFASPCEPGQTFNSAIEASGHLGFNNNDVALYMNKARRKFPDDSDAGQRTAKVRGVTLIYDADHALSYRD